MGFARTNRLVSAAADAAVLQLIRPLSAQTHIGLTVLLTDKHLSNAADFPAMRKKKAGKPSQGTD